MTTSVVRTRSKADDVRRDFGYITSLFADLLPEAHAPEPGDHRRPEDEAQEQRRDGPESTRAAKLVEALTTQRIGNLIVVLNKRDESRRRQIQSGRSASFLLPFVPLPLVKITPL